MGDLVKYGHADLSAHGVRVYGLRALMRDAKAVGVAVDDLKDLTYRLGLPIARLGALLAPKESGRLASQIKPARRRDRIHVSVGGARLLYAGRRHWGDPGTVGPVFLSRAEEMMRPRTIEKLGEGIMTLLRNDETPDYRETRRRHYDSPKKAQFLMNITSLTLGEAENIETISGVPFADLTDSFESGTLPPIKVLIALAYVFQRRDNPALTLDDVRAMSIDDLTALIGDDKAGDVSPESQGRDATAWTS